MIFSIWQAIFCAMILQISILHVAESQPIISVYIQVSQPNGGEEYFVGDTVTVEWIGYYTICYWDTLDELQIHVEYTTDSVPTWRSWKTLATRSINVPPFPFPGCLSANISGMTHWVTPKETSSTCKVKVSVELCDRSLPGDVCIWSPIASDRSDSDFTISPVTTVSTQPLISYDSWLSQNFPNPFNPRTTIRFDIPHRSNVSLVVYNMLGQQVVTLLNEQREIGKHEIAWNGINSEGAQVASGVYFYRLEAVSVDDPQRTFTQVRKMVLIR